MKISTSVQWLMRRTVPDSAISDGNWTLDVSGSYGLNVVGFERYKEWIAKGCERVKELGAGAGSFASDCRGKHTVA